MHVGALVSPLLLPTRVKFLFYIASFLARLAAAMFFGTQPPRFPMPTVTLAVAVAALLLPQVADANFLNALSSRFPTKTLLRRSGQAALDASKGSSFDGPPSSYFQNFRRRLVGFRPVYADTAVAELEESNEIAAPKSDESSARFFGLFNPFNPFNPFASLIAVPTNANGLNILQIKGKQPIVARVDLTNNNNNAVGKLNIFQESALKPLILVGAGGTLPAALANQNSIRMEIMTNAAGTGTGRCAAATLGSVFNPTGVADGGVLSTSVAADATPSFTTFISQVPVTRATLFSPNTILNRGIRLQLAGANVNGDDTVCGTITFVA